MSTSKPAMKGKYSDIGEPKVTDSHGARRSLIRDIKRDNCEEAVEEVLDAAMDAYQSDDGGLVDPEAMRNSLRCAFNVWSRRKS